MPVTLFLSVGGSPAPLKTSLRLERPDKVVLVVSDGADGSDSSASQEPELRAAEGCPQDVVLLKVPADDPDRAMALIEPHVAAELARGATVILDYTGGTKSMTSAMVLAAAAHEGARLRLMVGQRHGLTGVIDGTERPVDIPKALIGLAQSFTTLRAFAARRNYAAARALIDDLARELQGARDIQPPKIWRKRVARWRRWLAIMDLWDRFDHAAAWQQYESALEVGEAFADFDATPLGARLKALKAAKGKPTPELLEDLWLNAQRRAGLGLYDDAVQRLYRLAEAAVQTRLWVRHSVPTDDVDRNILPPVLHEKLKPRLDYRGTREVIKLGLSDALALLRHLDPEDSLAKGWGKENPDWQGKRNSSILAHGFTPMDQNAWKQARQWFDERRRLLWEDLLGRPTAEQLPDRLP